MGGKGRALATETIQFGPKNRKLIVMFVKKSGIFFRFFFELLSFCQLEINVYFCNIILKQQVDGNNYIAI